MRLVADANVLLAAVLGGRAAKVLHDPRVDEILTTETVMAEVRDYAPRLALKKHLSIGIALMAAAALPVT